MKIRGKISHSVAPVVYRMMGLDFFKQYKWLAEVEKWSDEERTQWRLDKLNKILDHCWENVHFYKDFWEKAGVSRGPLSCLEDLSQYPILTKEIIKSSAIPLQSNNLNSIRKKTNSTGGTTGQPLQYYQDLELWSLTQAFNLWGWGLAGYKFGHCVAVLGGYSLVPEKIGFKDRFRYLLDQKFPISGVHFDHQTGVNIFAQLKQINPDYIYGYPSLLSMLGRFLSDEGLSLASVKGVFTTAEMCQSSYRKNIEEGFNCKVWDQYGCNDGGIMACECSLHQGYHYSDMQVIVQTSETKTSEDGPLLITNLWNRSFPFIRYANGDKVTISKDLCPCGLPYPVLKSISGRTADILVFGNGRKLAGPALTLIFRNMDIAGWQVVQNSLNSVEVYIANSCMLQKEQLNYIKLAFKTHAGEGVDIKIVQGEKLQLTMSGKLKPIIIAIPD